MRLGTQDASLFFHRAEIERCLGNKARASAWARKALSVNSTFSTRFAPVARRLGWRPEFPWARLARWADAQHGVHVIERRPMPPLGRTGFPACAPPGIRRRRLMASAPFAKRTSAGRIGWRR
jgi:hypothetical protein